MESDTRAYEAERGPARRAKKPWAAPRLETVPVAAVTMGPAGSGGEAGNNTRKPQSGG